MIWCRGGEKSGGESPDRRNSEVATARAAFKDLHLGPFTNDVSGEREGRGWLISDDRRRRLRDLYTKNSDTGGRGSKISKI